MKALVKNKYVGTIYPEHPRALDADRDRVGPGGRIGGYPGGGGYTGITFSVAYNPRHDASRSGNRVTSLAHASARRGELQFAVLARRRAEACATAVCRGLKSGPPVTI